MKLKDRIAAAVRAFQEYPALRAGLGAAEYERKQAEHLLEQTEQECERLRETVEAAYNRLRFAEHRASALFSVLLEFTPKLSATEEMKRFYDALAPSLDVGGFTLYRVAEKLTGFDLYGSFPYEDACGMFAAADGRQLMRYLTASCFDAVEWQIVPGTTYEKAVLREVDTASPGYRQFESALYENVLKRMGFEELLEMKEQTLYSENQRLSAPQMTM